MFRVLTVCILGLIWATGVLAQSSETQQPYQLNAGDRINLRVVVWQEEQRAFILWPAINGDYKIQPEGSVTVSLVGTFKAAGQTTADLAEEIAIALGKKLGSVERPSTIIEVVEYSPFYILGDVERTGAYPAEPGLTALQAYALAGGAARRNSAGPDNPTSTLRDSGSLRQAQLELLRAEISSIRLAVEISQDDMLTFPPEMRHPDGTEALSALLDEEHQIFRSRRTAMERQESSLHELIELLEAEVSTLKTKIKSQQTQMDFAVKNLENVTSLINRGLARSPQVTEAQRALFDLEAKGLDLQNNVFRAQQSIKEAERDLVGLSSNRATQAAMELQNVNARSDGLRSRIDTLRRIILEQGAEVTSNVAPAKISTTFHIQRGSGETQQDLFGPNTLLLPGDVLTVSQTLESQDSVPSPPG